MSLAQPLRSNLDWVRAVLHVEHGQQGSALRSGAYSMLMVLLGVLAFRWYVFHRWGDAQVAISASGQQGAGMQAGGMMDGATWWLGGVALTDSAGTELFTVIVSGMLLAIVACMQPLVPRCGLRLPLSRERWARVLWWRTQVEELVYASFAIVALALLGVALARLADVNAWTNIGRWILGLVTLFALLPLARVMRLHLVGSPDPFADPVGMRGVLAWRAYVGVMTCMAALFLGTKLTMVGWDEAMLHVRAELPTDLRPWTFLLAAPPILLLRWIWLRILVRHFRTCDLNLG